MKAKEVCRLVLPGVRPHREVGGGGAWHGAMVLVRLPLAAPIGLSPRDIPTLCVSERVLGVSTEPLDDLSCLTTPGVGRPREGLLPVPLTGCIQLHTPSPCGGLPTLALTCAHCCVHLQDNRGGGGCVVFAFKVWPSSFTATQKPPMFDSVGPACL